MPALTPATLIYNARAGRGALAPPEALLSALEAAGYAADLWLTRSPDFLKELLAQVSGPVFLAGGDGTLRAAALHLLGRQDVVLGVIPMGTANNVARALGVHGPVLETARRYRQARAVPFDVGRMRGGWGTDYFLEAGGCGLFAEVLDDYNPERPKSPWRAAGSLAEALTRCAPHTHQVWVDQNFHPGPPLRLLEVMNTPSTGNGLRLASGADPSDGLLDVVRVSGLGRTPWLAAASALLRGTFHTLPGVTVLRGREVRIHDHGQVFHADTEVRRSTQPGGMVDIDAWEGALRVLRLG